MCSSDLHARSAVATTEIYTLSLHDALPISALAASTLADEEGCYAYAVYESTATPGTFVTVEAWRSQADMDAHMGTPHIGKAFEVLGPVIAGDIAIHPLKAV